MKKKDILTVIEELSKLYPNPTTELLHRNPFELVVATLLSAQCTDKRVNMVTPALFARCPDPKSLSEIPLDELKNIIKSINFFQNKARHLIGLGQMLCEEFDGIVPQDRESLERLPGVGRKTANVVLANAFGIPALAVDTHVHRVTNRLGMVKEKEPLMTEQALMKILPEEVWIDAHHYFILHGRKVCDAKKPKCIECTVRSYCAYYKKIT